MRRSRAVLKGPFPDGRPATTNPLNPCGGPDGCVGIRYAADRDPGGPTTRPPSDPFPQHPTSSIVDDARDSHKPRIDRRSARGPSATADADHRMMLAAVEAECLSADREPALAALLATAWALTARIRPLHIPLLLRPRRSTRRAPTPTTDPPQGTPHTPHGRPLPAAGGAPLRGGAVRLPAPVRPAGPRRPGPSAPRSPPVPPPNRRPIVTHTSDRFGCCVTDAWPSPIPAPTKDRGPRGECGRSVPPSHRHRLRVPIGKDGDKKGVFLIHPSPSRGQGFW